jgi:hypothetical protein
MKITLHARMLALAVFAGLCLGGMHLAAQQDAPDKKTDAPKPAKLDVTFSGPFKHDNLTIFLIHGKDKLQGKNYLLLPEAMEQKKVIIFETKQVNDLQIENVSPGDEVLLLAGDIISGGQQDRVITMDQILPPKSGKLTLKVNCVEKTAARWMSAWKEKDKTFHACTAVLNSKALRLGNNVHMSQAAVWKDVTVCQKQLSERLKVVAKAAESDSSLNLTLQVKEVKQAADQYATKLQDIPKGKTDVIGYAFAINGKVYGVDVYGSNAVFLKVWPRLMQANAVEAVMEKDPNQSHKHATLDQVKAFLADADSGKVSSKQIGMGLQRIQSDAKTNTHIQTINPAGKALIRDAYYAH